MKNSIQIILVLVVFVFIAGFAITFAHQKTKGTIDERRRQAQEHSLMNVLSQGSTAVIDSVEGFGQYWKEYDGDKNLVGLAFIGYARGYSSIISFFCGLDLNGDIKGVSIISQYETPGLGTRVEEVISNEWFPMGLLKKREEATPWFCDQYKGISALKKIHLNKNAEWHALSQEEKDKLLKSNQISVITGSTITTAAITNELTAKAKLLISLIDIHEASKSTSELEATVERKNEDDDETENGDELTEGAND
jgi:electron transport complex protein RnfG